MSGKKRGVRIGITRDELTKIEFDMVSAEEDVAVAELLDGVPPEGGSASRKMLDALLRTAFNGGHVVTLAAVRHRLTGKEGAQ